jgi:DNA-directed RNA polymerase III subunit RPC2
MLLGRKAKARKDAGASTSEGEGEDQGEFPSLKSLLAALPEPEPSAPGKSLYAPEDLHAKVDTIEDKWKLLPHFLRMRGLMRQHIDSFDYFLNTDIKKIVGAKANREVLSEADPKFFLQYTDVHVGEPSMEEDDYTVKKITPFECRLRDCTYAAPIFVDVRYTRGNKIVNTKNVPIGRIPIMLRSCKCILSGKSEEELSKVRRK